MLPLTQKDTRLSRGPLGRLSEKLQNWMRLIYSDRNSRNLFLFLILNLSFAFVELFYGVWSNSLGSYFCLFFYFSCAPELEPYPAFFLIGTN